MNCVILENIQSDRAVIRGTKAGHIINVLKKGPGEMILAGILHGPVGLVRIVSVDHGEVTVELPTVAIPPAPTIDLILAMPRPKVMKRLWLPLASIGVRSITIIGAAKVEPFYFASHALDPGVYNPLMIEGLEQARDTHMPRVHIIKSFDWFAREKLPGTPPSAHLLIADPQAAQSIRKAMSINKAKDIVLAVGPEGGWLPEELDVFYRYNFQAVTMGTRTLRTDTAVISLLAIIRDGLSAMHNDES